MEVVMGGAGAVWRPARSVGYFSVPGHFARPTAAGIGPVIPISRPSLGAEELAAVGEVFASGWLGLGDVTRAFEQEVAAYLGCAHVVAVNSGTSALHIALAAQDIGPGDEVLVPSITFAATIHAVLATGATPVFCESIEDSVLLDPDDVARQVTPRTRAVIPVHLGGSPCDMDALVALAEGHGFRVIEDAAHAFGSLSNGRRIGSFGHATCFSFDPIKTLTCGEGGAVAVPDAEAAERLRTMRDLGFSDSVGGQPARGSSFRAVTAKGFRYHLPNFCAAIGRVQLRKVDAFIERRQALCRRYDAAFGALDAVRIRPVDYRSVAPHIYIVRVVRGSRDAFAAAVEAAGIGTGRHYVANHVQPYFAPYATRRLPVADRVWRQLVTLPLHAGLTDADVTRVIDAVVSAERDVLRGA